MALLIKKVLLDSFPSPLMQTKRFRGPKINLKRPKPPHFEKAVVLQVTKPYYPSQKKHLKPIELCANLEPSRKEEEDNPYQNLLAKELLSKIQKSRLIGLFHLNPMPFDDHFRAFVTFKKVKMDFENYGKKTLEIAIKGSPYEILLDFYVSHNMLVFSEEANIKDMLKVAKKFPQIVLLAAVVEGRLVDKDQLLKYGKIANLQAARASLVQTLNSVGGQFVSHLNRGQGSLVSHLEQRIKQLGEG